ncbi:hypothetical protein [Streptomyces montanisoli]|uniref:Uncharacterized protein n=1 Tax=Streptomyces montanisoli TaxID=2798581 RepID=A0A940MLE9_9ACTN|nr:hypothetical protein [Streptomyces montanisoli]MBP0461997.1 hypothetical protein [Streptomyces montanisoli]
MAYVDLFSDRTSLLTIDAMHARTVRCRPAAATTVVRVPSQGAGPRQGLLFDLTKQDSAAIATGEGTAHEGKPYFRYSKIDLGDGATPGALRVEAVTSTKDCDWVIDVEYSDSQGTHKTVVKDGKKPFFAAGVPADPASRWILNEQVRAFVDCDAHRDAWGCKA